MSGPEEKPKALGLSTREMELAVVAWRAIDVGNTTIKVRETDIMIHCHLIQKPMSPVFLACLEFFTSPLFFFLGKETYRYTHTKKTPKRILGRS